MAVFRRRPESDMRVIREQVWLWRSLALHGFDAVPQPASLAAAPSDGKIAGSYSMNEGYEHGGRLTEIGTRLGVTRERARQIEGQALRKLRGDRRLRRALVDLVSA